MIQSINRKATFAGSLLGLAIGDALGTAAEFKKAGSFEPITDILGGGPFDLKPGEWTDATSMAMCLVESLLASEGFNASDQMNRYLDWYENGYWSCRDFCFNIEDTVRKALQHYKTHQDPYCGSTDAEDIGAASLVRLAAIPLFYINTPQKALLYAAESSRTTHATPICVDACRYFAGLMIGASSGEDKAKLLAPGYSPIPEGWQASPLCPEIAAIAQGSYREKPDFFIESGNTVTHALEAALWAFHRSSNYKEGALLLVNLGGCASTTGAIYGQLAGAYYGLDGLPDNWLRKIIYHKHISDRAEDLWYTSMPSS